MAVNGRWRALARDKVIVIALILILACLFGLLVPVVRCTYCLGLGSVTIEEMCIVIQIQNQDEPARHLEFWGCDRCDRRGRVTIHEEWRHPWIYGPDATPHGDLLRSVRKLRDAR
jgi:hypothetical protein